jgi:hypothetical protein
MVLLWRGVETNLSQPWNIIVGIPGLDNDFLLQSKVVFELVVAEGIWRRQREVDLHWRLRLAGLSVTVQLDVDVDTHEQVVCHFIKLRRPSAS